MKYSNDFVPILSNEDIEQEATKFLKEFYPMALSHAMEVPIELIAERELGLSIDYAHLTEDLTILGMMVFSDGKVEVYNKEEDEFIYQEVNKGTIIIDPDIYSNGGIGRERFTIAHELAHWNIHGFRFAMLAYSDKQLTVACKYSSERIVHPKTPEEWIEAQADKMAAAILMPREMFKKEANRLTNEYMHDEGNFMVGSTFDPELIQRFIVAELARIFKVSKAAAKIRLITLGLSP